MLNLDPDIGDCELCGKESKVEVELLVNFLPEGVEGMIPNLCESCASTDARSRMEHVFETLRHKIVVTKFKSMTDLAEYYEIDPKEEDTAAFKIPMEPAKQLEPKSRW